MKALRLEIRNIGLIADAVIEINKPLILFYGDVSEGKTTYLNAVRWVFGGAFPADIIRHGETEAFIQLTLDDGVVRRGFYIARDGSTKSRPLAFTRAGVPVREPVDEIAKFLNPFLLDQNFLLNKNELARKKYFAELFETDSAALDAEHATLAKQASEARAKLSGYGDIDCTPVPEPTSTATLIADRRILQDKQQKEIQAIIDSNRAIITANNARAAWEKSEVEFSRQVDSLAKQLADANRALAVAKEYLQTHPVQFESPVPTPAGTPDLDTAIEQAAADAVRYAQHLANKTRALEKTTFEKSLSTTERRQDEIRCEKIARLSQISATCGIEGLQFEPDGNFIYVGTAAGMLSTSQLMTLSSALSAKYPSGFGLELLDRGESLGTSIFKFIDKAKAENKSILATVVGEYPATVPENVGVFVVEQGRALAR
jgi:hypothetical protein